MAQMIRPGKRTLMTHIGRRVDNWWDYDKDLILKILYDRHIDKFNIDDLPLGLNRLWEMADLEPQKAKDICDKLKKENFISEEEEFYYKITPDGVEFVERQMSKV